MCHLKTRQAGGEHDLIGDRQPPPERAGLPKSPGAVNRAKASDLANSVIGVRPHTGDLLKLRGLEAGGVKIADWVRDAIRQKLAREVV